jgi:hypothetical protein
MFKEGNNWFSKPKVGTESFLYPSENPLVHVGIVKSVQAHIYSYGTSPLCPIH